MIKGLTLDQFHEIVEFVQKHHRFALYIPKEERPIRKEHFPKLSDMVGFGIKYIDSCYDSRDRTIWMITFRRGNLGIRFTTNHYNAMSMPPEDWKYNNLYDLCLDYLTGEFEPSNEFYINLNEK